MNQAAGGRNWVPWRPPRGGIYESSGRVPSGPLPAGGPAVAVAAIIEQKAREAAAFVYYHRLCRVKEHVEQAFADDISLTSAARVAGLEAKYFSCYFRQKTGRCFKHWLAERRIEKAMRMMKAGDYAISEVAFAVGFRDLRTFQRSFKKYTGTTPRAYRASVRPT